MLVVRRLSWRLMPKRSRSGPRLVGLVVLVCGNLRPPLLLSRAVPVPIGDHLVREDLAVGAAGDLGASGGRGGGRDLALGHGADGLATHGGEGDLVGGDVAGGGGGVGGAADELGGGEPGPDLLVDQFGGLGAQDRAAGRAGVGDG